MLRDAIKGVTRPAIRRLARRGGVRRLAGLMYDETRPALTEMLKAVVESAVNVTTHQRAARKTVTRDAVLHALKRAGRTLLI